MALISVIVPIYNSEKYLERCVKSIQSQTYFNLEIILVNDGSTDNSLSLCKKFEREDCRVKVINKKNAGQGLARNDGLKIATGEYITFVDSDDWIGEDHIYNLYNCIVRSNSDAVLGNHIWVDINGNRTTKMLALQEGSYKGDRLLQEIILPLIGANLHDSNDIIVNSSVSMNLYRRNIISDNKIEFISERFAIAEDFFFNLDFFCHSSQIDFCKEQGYFYCQNIESTCEKYNPERFARTLNYYNFIYDRIRIYGIKENVDFRIERSFLMKIRVAIRHIVMSDLSKKEKYDQIKKILKSKIVKEALSKYPIDTYDFPIRLLTKMMKKERVAAVYYLMCIREKGQSNSALKKLMRFCGLRR
jgi:glycosyltransferase involved in cell wall biosynthesis